MYKQLPQRGELGYNQPTFPIILSKSEVCIKTLIGYRFIFAKHPIQVTTKNLVTKEEHIHTYENEYACDVATVIEIEKKYKRQALKQCFRLVEESEETIFITPSWSELELKLTFRKKVVPIISTKNVGLIRASSFAEICAIANYFQDRLPKAFFDTYLGFAIEAAY